MLASVRIKDFALIADLTMEFGENLNALTGETGAGKSIIVEAIGLLVGERAATASIRGGAGSAYVEGMFEFADAAGLGEALAELGIESEDGALIVSREITPSRSIARLNGRAVPLRALQQVTAALVDIQGQSEQLSLFQPARQLFFLDAFAGIIASWSARSRRCAGRRGIGPARSTYCSTRWRRSRRRGWNRARRMRCGRNGVS